jgi:opacity protein-like surface antigen
MVLRPSKDKKSGTEACQNTICSKYLLASLIVFSVGLLILTPAAIAGAGNGYVGLGIGSVLNASPDKGKVYFDAPDVQSEQVLRLFGGYQLNDHFSIEGSYIDLGSVRVNEQVFGDYYQSKVTGFELTPVGSLPIGKDLSVFVRGGLIFWRSDVTFRLVGSGAGSGSKSSSGNDFVLGAGAKYDFTSHLGVRAEYSAYSIDKVAAGFGNFQIFLVSGVIAF